MDGLVEEVVEQQVLQVWVGAVGVGDVLEEDGADDAAASPHQSNGRLVELPLVYFSSLQMVSSVTLEEEVVQLVNW